MGPHASEVMLAQALRRSKSKKEATKRLREVNHGGQRKQNGILRYGRLPISIATLEAALDKGEVTHTPQTPERHIEG